MAAPPVVDPLIGKLLAKRFEIIERVGEGGSGVVYRAKQISVDRIVAIKVLGAHVSTDPTWAKRFHNEARAASRLKHPNTVSLIDFDSTPEGLLWIAMEFLEGRSLRTELDRVKKMPPERVLRVVQQICGSLGEAHNQGIIHRDIKPDNIYLLNLNGNGDYVKVLDFSIAKLDAPDANVTRAGMVFGTPAYMSPEQGRGVKLDQRSDVYAVGVVMYEMLAGRAPFDAKMPAEIVMMHLRDQPPALQGYPPAIVEVIMKSLQKDPRLRQQTVGELEHECANVLAQMGGGFARPALEPTPVIEKSIPDEAYRPESPPEPKRAQRTMALPDPSAAITPDIVAPSVKIAAQSAAPHERTMALQPLESHAANRTVALPASDNVIAFSGEALEVRESVVAVPITQAAFGFWAAWGALGVGVGIIVHFLVR